MIASEVIAGYMIYYIAMIDLTFKMDTNRQYIFPVNKELALNPF